MADGCIFCRIVRGEAPASMLYEDDDVVAFLDTRPVNPGHTLVVPRIHAPLVIDLSAGVAAHLFEIGVRIDQAVRQTDLRADAVTFLLRDGEAAGQEVMHVHLHVIPRFRGDGFRIETGPRDAEPFPTGRDEAVASRIRDRLS